MFPLPEPWQRLLIDAIDGERSVQALVRLAGDPGADGTPGVCEPFEALFLIKSLRYLRLLEGSGAELLDAIAAARERPAALLNAAPWTTLPGAQFDCHQCAACCRNHRLGPLREADVVRLDALDGLEAHFSSVTAHGRVRRDGDGEWYLPQREDGRCIYLQDDLLCGIHARYGPEHKPDMCHLFPTGASPTLFGIAVYDRADCKSYGKSAFRGEPYADRAQRLRPQLKRLAKSIPLFHPAVNLDGYVHLDYGYFAPFEAYLDALLRDARLGASLGDAFGAMREATLHLLAVLTSADDAEHTPAELIRAVVSVPPAARGRGHGPPRDRGRGDRALRRWLVERRQGLTRCLHSSRGDIPQGDARANALERFVGVELDLAMRDIDALVWRLDDRVRAPRSLPTTDPKALERVCDAARSVTLDAEALQLTRRMVRLTRDLLFSKWYAESGTFTNAVALFTVLLAAIELGGRLSAAAARRTSVTAEDMDAAQTRALRLFRMPGLKKFAVRIGAAQAFLRDLTVPIDFRMTTA